MNLHPSSSASTDRSCMACMYPQHTSAFFVNGMRISSPEPVLAWSRLRQSSASSRALPIACALSGNPATTVSQIRAKARVIFTRHIHFLPGFQWWLPGNGPHAMGDLCNLEREPTRGPVLTPR